MVTHLPTPARRDFESAVENGSAARFFGSAEERNEWRRLMRSYGRAAKRKIRTGAYECDGTLLGTVVLLDFLDKMTPEERERWERETDELIRRVMDEFDDPR